MSGVEVPTRFLILLAALLFTSCGQAAREQRALPSGPPKVIVRMNNYRYEFDRAVPAGRVVFEFLNVGRVDHRPVLIPLPEDVPPIAEQVRGEDRQVATPFAGVPALEPGERGTFAVDLAPHGRYALICLARDADGTSHALQGMVAEFRTEAENGSL